MSSKFFALAALIVLPLASQAAERDMHVFQDCPSTSYEACVKYQRVLAAHIGKADFFEVHDRLQSQLAEPANDTLKDVGASMKAEQVRWASLSAAPEVLADMHINQMCMAEGATCFDIHHFDENKKLIDLRLENLKVMTDLRDHATMNKAAADFVQKRIATKVEGLKKDRVYLLELHRASMMDAVKHDITIELRKINEAIAKNDGATRSSSTSASGKSLK